MNSAICVHFVKECLVHSCRSLVYLYIFFTILIRMNGVTKGKWLMCSCFSLLAREKAVHLKLSSQAHQSRKVEVT